MLVMAEFFYHPSLGAAVVSGYSGSLNVLLHRIFQLPFGLLQHFCIESAFPYGFCSCVHFIHWVHCNNNALCNNDFRKRYIWNTLVVLHPSDICNYTLQSLSANPQYYIENSGSCLTMNQCVNGWLTLGVEQMRSSKLSDAVAKTWGSL